MWGPTVLLVYHVSANNSTITRGMVAKFAMVVALAHTSHHAEVEIINVTQFAYFSLSL